MKHTKEPWSLGEITVNEFNVQEQGINADDAEPNSVENLATVYGDTEEDIANSERIVACVNALAGIENPSKLDFEFIAQALNAHWNAMNWNLTEVKDLGDIERKNYEYAREKAKEQLALLTQ